MLGKTISLYRKAYSGLTPSTWLLSLVMLVNRSGTMVIPFMTIYLIQPSMGYSIGLSGGGLLFLLLGQMKSFPLICGVTFALSLVNEAFRPANSTAIAHFSREEN